MRTLRTPGLREPHGSSWNRSVSETLRPDIEGNPNMSATQRKLTGMVDPILGLGAVAKAVESAADEGGKSAGGLVSRVFGPAADEIGQALGRFTSYRVGNVKRIAENADQKARGRDGMIPPRLAHSMLEDASFCDDELMAEYLGGVLAAGRSPSGRDDRAVTWSKMVTSMSSLQLRTHFVFYREWAYALHGNTQVKLSTNIGQAVMYVDLDDLYPILAEAVPDLAWNDTVTDVLTGLSRFDLIGDAWAVGTAANIDSITDADSLPFERVFRAYPTITGLALYGWACGLPGVSPADFTQREELLAIDVPVARPAVHLPNIDDEDLQSPPSD